MSWSEEVVEGGVFEVSVTYLNVSYAKVITRAHRGLKRSPLAFWARGEADRADVMAVLQPDQRLTPLRTDRTSDDLPKKEGCEQKLMRCEQRSFR